MDNKYESGDFVLEDKKSPGFELNGIKSGVSNLEGGFDSSIQNTS